MSAENCPEPPLAGVPPDPDARREDQMSEEEIDQNLMGSFPASDPPSWTLGVGGKDPADAAVRSDRRREVLAALATLPPEQRAALVLVDMGGHSVEEAASILGVPSGTVKSRCSRGRARLLPLLAGNRPGTPDVPSMGTATGGVDPRSEGGGRR